MTSYSGDMSLRFTDMYVLSSSFGFTYCLALQSNAMQTVKKTFTQRDTPATAKRRTWLCADVWGSMLLTQKRWLADPTELELRQSRVERFFSCGWSTVRLLVRPVSLRLLIAKEWLTGDPSKYHCKVGEGFPTVLQEHLSWASAMVQWDEGRICGETETHVEKTDFRRLEY